MPSTPHVACRLFVILAREAPVGIIFRRGPSKWTQIIKWNTDSDIFEYGAWFHGQFYPERCDISPDGTKLIYFATNYAGNGSIEDRDDDFPVTWTAISKIPWLTALLVWPNMGTYFGGGVFDTNTKVSVNQDIHDQLNFDQPDVPPDLEVSFERQFWDHNWHTLFRLEREGWKPKEAYPWGSIPKFTIQQDGKVVVQPTDPNCPLDTPSHIRTIHEKDHPGGQYSLIMTSVYDRAEKNQTFEVKDNVRHTVTPIKRAVWADWDKKGRLVFAREGKLFTGTITYHSDELVDFNPSKPKRTTAPRWAREW